MECCHNPLAADGDRILEISSSDRASFPVGFLGQRLDQLCCTNDRWIANLLKLDYFFKPMRSPCLTEENYGDRIPLAMVAIASANASKMAECSSF
jgi:hypothetical protein